MNASLTARVSKFLWPTGLGASAASCLPRAEFYAAVNQPTTALVMATGEEQRFANILITIGAVKKEQR